MITKNFKAIMYSFFLVTWSACDKDDDRTVGLGEDAVVNSFEEVLGLKKDKARYDPGEEVVFTVDVIHPNTTIKYKFLGEIIAEEMLSGTSWNWTPPAEDFKGYMIELVKVTNGEETILGTTAVDVSSDWTKFPRYGFLSEFGNMSQAEMTNVLDDLKDFHINGLQYYDWHNKHHIPLPVDENGSVADSWPDIFNRNISLETLQRYIAEAKDRNMASMFYNLLFGVWNAEGNEGISNKWLLYNDRLHNSINSHSVGDPGSILLTDPANEDWRNYIFEQTAKVYENLEFDGWHLDQLGDRGTVFDFNGNVVPLKRSYEGFLHSLKQSFPDKKMVLNAVDQFAQGNILKTPVDFAYSEVWTRVQYQDLVSVILENNSYSNGQLNTVLAAYLNYGSPEGTFNTPSVLLADAVIFAFGGSHLELGEHMLSSEYFPNDKLSMEDELVTAIGEYYDFLVAYENLLRNGGEFNTPVVSSTDGKVAVNNWPPIFGKASVIGKQFNDRQVLHMINFTGISTLGWRDNEKIQTAPMVANDFGIKVSSDRPVSKVWFATPDVRGGASQELEFRQEDNEVIINVPYLEYWSMFVIEY